MSLIPEETAPGAGFHQQCVQELQRPRKLQDLWAQHTGTVLFRSPDQPRGLNGRAFPEGALSRVEDNRYERDPRARKACLTHKGYRCAVCDFSFEERYGPLGHNFIHVHHTLELSRVPPGYRVDPVNDLRPVCPNCHAMIHRGPGPALPVDEFRRQSPQDPSEERHNCRLSCATGTEPAASCWPGVAQFEWQGHGRLLVLICQLI